jgi:hypothetical protein
MAQFIFVDTATKLQIISRESIPDESAAQWITDVLPGLDPIYTLLAFNEPFARPNNDERINTIAIIEQYVNTSHPLYTQLKQWARTYTVTPKTTEEISAVIDDLEALANQSTIPTAKQLKYTVLGLEYLYAKLVDLRTLTNKETKIVTKFRKQAGKIAQNHQVKLDKNNILTGGTTPPLDTDWQNNDFVAE